MISSSVSNGNTIYISVLSIIDISTVFHTIVIYTVKSESHVYSYYQVDNTSEDSALNKLNYLVISSVVFLLLLLVCVVFFYVYINKSYNHTSSCSSHEMIEETGVFIDDSISNIVHNDNPLWLTSMLDDNDDPFRNDFEETGNPIQQFRVGLHK